MCFVWGNVQKSLQIQKPDSTKERKNIIKSLGNIKKCETYSECHRIAK